MKLMALLLFFNSKAAALVSLLWSIVLGLVATQSGVSLLHGNFWMFSSYFVFLACLFFGQRIRVCFRSPWMVFLDKLCIHQENDELKQKGILGLGAFIFRSDKLLILWSKRTFSRLWCAYEIGCFLSRSRPLDQIEILPVAMAAILFGIAVIWHAVVFGYALTIALLKGSALGAPAMVGYVNVMVLPVACIVLVWVTYLGISMLDDLEALPQQLQNFRIQDSECYCCTNRHKHPLTGERMICDRQLVYESLTDLYLQQGNSVPLEKFNSNVHERLGPRILQKIQVKLPMRYLARMVFVSGWPLLFKLIWDISQGPQSPLKGSEYAVWCVRHMIEFLQPFSAMIFSYAFSMRVWKLHKIMFFRSRKICFSILASPAIAVAVAGFWGSVPLTRALSEETNSLIPLLPFILGLVTNFLLHCF
eukprot:Skav205217  [mRNA]  locus=scaffold400:157781:159037:- [translate_table: standard]